MRNTMAQALCLLAAIAVAGATTLVHASGFVVIVRADNPITTLSKDEISDMFLKKTTRWNHGTPVVPVNLESKSRVRAAFSTAIHGRSTGNIESYWQQQIFSGKKKPPLVVPDDAQMVFAVLADPGAIGYVAPEATLDGVRALSVMIPPERVSYQPPRYTAGARRARITGEVVLEVSINAEGNVVDATPIKELGFGLTREAVNAVSSWKYKPATLNDQPVETVITVSLRFDPNS